MKGWLAFGLLALLGCGGSAAAVRPPGAPPPAPRVISGNLDSSVLFADLPARASHAGAGPASVVAASETTEGERVGAFVEVPRELCLLAYARASSSVDDVDVAAFGDEGEPIAADDAPDPHPTILFCPPHPGRVYVAARAASGEGLVAVGAQLVTPDHATDVARAVGARGALGPRTRPADSWPGLDDHVRLHREALGGRWEEFRKVAVSVDARAPSYVSFPIEADQCTDAVIVPDEDVAVLEVEVVDETGRAVARARESARDRALTVCSPVTMNGSLMIRPHVGQGLAAVVLARAKGEVANDLSARPEIAWVAPSQSLDVTRAARNAVLAKAGYGPATSASAGTLVIGRRTSLLVNLEAQTGVCSRIDVVGGAPLALIDAAAWDESGSLLSSAQGASAVTLFACGRGKAHLDLEARGRAGPFAELVRPERWQNQAFAQHPLAAARMLGRAAVGPESLLQGTPIAVRSVTLDASRRIAYDETIPAGRCLRVAVGAEGEGTGLELRLFDRGSSDELDRSHAERAVGVRACAPSDGARPVRIELRATSGKLDAVVGERVDG